MLPPEPVTFSITTGVPQASVSLSPTTRATVSPGPPATNDPPEPSGVAAGARAPKSWPSVRQRRRRGHDTDGLHRCSPVVSTDQAAEKNATAAPAAGRKSLDVLLCGAI